MTSLGVPTAPRADRKATIVQYAAENGGSSATSLLLVLGFGVVIYFFMIRPQQRRRREVQQMQAGMGPGDEIITVGGLYGTIRSIDDESVLLEIAPGVTAKYARAAIGKVNQKADGGDEAAEDATPAPGAADTASDAD